MYANVMCVGFSTNTHIPQYKVADEKEKLTIEEMNSYVSAELLSNAQLTDSNSYDMHKDVADTLATMRSVPSML
jgi:salicylate hydroxylase